MKILIYLMEKHLVPFPELIGSTKHEIKQHLIGCKVVQLPAAARAGDKHYIFPHYTIQTAELFHIQNLHI